MSGRATGVRAAGVGASTLSEFYPLFVRIAGASL